MTTSHPTTPPICDYEGSPYRTAFWNQERRYEDQADRLALQRLLPARGRRLAEIGAGFGRLAPLYEGYEHIILVDYSSSLLREAQARLGQGGRVSYVVANLYHLPLADESLDTAVTVRVLHHVKDLPSALGELARVLKRGGVYVTEYANKRNLKAIIRYYLGRQTDNPFSAKPYEFVPLNIDFHPRYMEGVLNEVGLVVEERLAVSTFRIGLLKRLVPASVLAWLDSLIMRPTARLRLAPSMFVRARRRSRLADRQ